MVKITCNLKEFTYLFDPRIKNNIASMTRSTKRKQGSKCQKCGEVKELDAAHKHNNSRPDIIKKVIENYKKEDGQYEIHDILQVINEINDAHKPVEDHFLFLCKTCHKEYDSQDKPNRKIIKKNNMDSRQKDKPSNENLCKKETQSWKYKIGWTSIKKQKEY